jgi:hypothetical protein
MRYIGPTGCTFVTRYKEFLKASQTDSGNLNFSKHVVNSGHSFGKMERQHVSSFYNKEGETH